MSIAGTPHTVTIDGLSPGQQYDAYCAQTQSLASQKVSFTTNFVVKQPSILENTGTGIRLSTSFSSNGFVRCAVTKSGSEPLLASEILDGSVSGVIGEYPTKQYVDGWSDYKLWYKGLVPGTAYNLSCAMNFTKSTTIQFVAIPLLVKNPIEIQNTGKNYSFNVTFASTGAVKCSIQSYTGVSPPARETDALIFETLFTPYVGNPVAESNMPHTIAYNDLIPGTQYAVYCTHAVLSHFLRVPKVLFTTPSFVNTPSIDTYQSNKRDFEPGATLGAIARVRFSHYGRVKCIIMLANLTNPTAYDILSTDEPLYSLIAYPNEVHSIPILSGDVLVQEVDYKLLCAQGDIMEQGSLAFDSSINTIRMSRLWEDGKILRIKNLGANRVTIVTRFTRSAECRCTVLDISSVADLMNANVSTLTPAPQQVAAFEEISIEIDGMVADTTYTVTCAQAESVDFSLRLYTPYSLVTEKDNIIASALKVRRINVDSVTLSIAFSSTNFARCILFNKDLAGNVNHDNK